MPSAVGAKTPVAPVLLLTSSDGPWAWRRTRYELLDGELDQATTSYKLSSIRKLRSLGSVMRTQDGNAVTFEFDAAEPLRHMRGDFHIPLCDDGSGVQQAYLAGNSLGLLPKSTEAGVKGELDKWAARGVMGHFEGALPWATCEDASPPLVAELVGPKHPALEVGAMNSLTVNLHMLMAAFYRPSDGRAAIIIEAGAFPSDRYAVGSQIRHHGRDPSEWLIEIQPR